jgi:hypothetical protein
MMTRKDLPIGTAVTLRPKYKNGKIEYGIVTGHIHDTETTIYVFYPFSNNNRAALTYTAFLSLGWPVEEIIKIPEWDKTLAKASIYFEQIGAYDLNSDISEILANMLNGIKNQYRKTLHSIRPGNYLNDNGREVAPTQAESFIEERQNFPKQTEIIIEVLQTAKEPLTARNIQKAAATRFKTMLLTSVRRALSDLEKAGHICGDEYREDHFTGKRVKAYYIPFAPVNETKQIELF